MEVDVAPHPKRADACRPAELVGGERQEVDAERVHVDRQTAGALHGVAVQADAPPAKRGRDGRHGCDRADLAVGESQAGERSARHARRHDVGGGDASLTVDRHHRTGRTVGLERPCGLEH